MDFASLDLMKMMQRKMGYHAERQDLLANNVAQIDTPGFTPVDIKTPDFEKMVTPPGGKLKMATTDGQHFLSGPRASGAYRTNEMKDTYQITPMENSSSVEEQMMMVAENQMEYQKVSNLYTKMTRMFKTAIGNN